MILLEYVEDRGIRKTEVDGWYDTKCVEVYCSLHLPLFVILVYEDA